MLSRFPARQRIEAIDETVEALSGRLEEVVSRFDRLADEMDRLSADLDQVRHRLDAEASDRREQMDQLSAVRDVVAELQSGSRTALEAVAALDEDGRKTSDVIAGQASHLDTLQERGLHQQRSLDQIRADVTRIERQAAADLAEFRATNTALARVVLNADGTRSRSAS